MIHTTLLGCTVDVLEGQDERGGALRTIVAQDPRSGDAWLIPLDLFHAMTTGRKLLGQAIAVPHDNEAC